MGSSGEDGKGDDDEAAANWFISDACEMSSKERFPIVESSIISSFGAKEKHERAQMQ
jgi:hypothetical protein